MFSLNKIHDNAFGGIGDRYAHYIDPHHFLGRNALDDALWNSKKPRSNVKRTEDHYHIEVAVPGFSKDEISVNLIGDRLVVECTKTDFEDQVPAEIHKEYGYNQISRSFILPQDVNQEGISTKYHDGILDINLPITKKTTSKSVTVN